MEKERALIKLSRERLAGFQPIVKPLMGDPPLKYIGFSLLNLKMGEEYRMETMGKECLILLLRGKGWVELDGEKFCLGERVNVFVDRAYAIYIPANKEVLIGAEKNLEAGVIFAPSQREGDVILIQPEDVRVRRVGEGNFFREVHDVLREDMPAEKLIVGETFNPPGNWSSYPPHRHDENNPPEKIWLEEVYHFRFQPEEGFGFMRLYDDELTINEALIIENRDSVIITKGYHPVVSAPGYFLYYLWILAGDIRKLVPINDPRHSWVIGQR
ncbi:5-deoxy-glucuronate isomerase [bacterium]|nr:5-deoxy-glucuronate isomerase [bacterium]